ncbi:DNA-binding MarR family transcriptional regulator [Marmoricola sp. OAE513]|uniref:MarR family winged helix-turn-helix transcriptional regulator n=1 Tax=Marmoricola sp. OAE513 TaxID=2817894 RepID=UPI001AE3E5EB
MGTPRDTDEQELALCASFPTDLTMLLHAAAGRMTDELDLAAVQMGLNDVRDWLVLAALDDGRQRTQLELSRVVCVDKTTLISVLDRLEKQDLVVRTVDPSDRRVRIPQITATGRKAYAKFAVARDAAEAAALEGVDEADRALLLGLLARIASRQDATLAAT